jgi:uncharacterized protein YecE (DUF72 family)
VSATVFIGTAGWSLPKADQPRFPGEGTHLQRYARVLGAAEINSSFYRPHRPETYARWAASVPDPFRFSVKLPKTITHERRLLDCEELLAAFLDQVQGLGEKLGCLLVQLPPSLGYHASFAGAFFAVLRALHDGSVALEPRHATWFTSDAADAMREYGVARVAADPARVPAAATPGGAREVVYYRLHGSPRVYYSRYDGAYLDSLAAEIDSAAQSADAVWCIFDNTAAGCAIPNGLDLVERLQASAGRPAPLGG